jgi:arylsulfatase A-like enzyme
MTPPTQRWIHFALLGVCAGVLGGLLEGVGRSWLQLAGVNNFEMRLTALSPRLLWAAPLWYAVLFGSIGLLFAAASRVVPRLEWSRPALVVLGALAFLPLVVATGRIANVSALILALGLGVAIDRLLPQSPSVRTRLVRRGTPWLVLAAAVAALGVEFSERYIERRQRAALPALSRNAPNVLLIILDTLRADHLPTYGYARPTAPALTDFARQGLQFDRAIAGSSWSLPSHVSLLTGRYPSEHGADIDRYDGRFQSIASAFLEQGYSTAAISANTLVFSRAQGFGPGFLRFDDSFYSLADGFTRTIYGRQIHKAFSAATGTRFHPVKRPAAAVTRGAQKWMAEHRDRPFFLVLNYFDLHDPEESAEPWPEDPRSKTAVESGEVDAGQARAGYSQQEIEQRIDAYDSALLVVDRSLSELLRYLDAEGLSRNTVVAVTSDHGELLGQHGRMAHGVSLYMPEIHVPLIMRFPGSIPEGVRISTPVSQTSVSVTLLDLAGAAGRVPFPGDSLTQLWANPARATGWPLPIAELKYQPWQRSIQDQDSLRSLVDGPWHYIAHSRNEPELFNLNEDPAEANNLAALPAYQEAVRKYEAHLGLMRRR